jgi:conjugal transfer/type IV secretion protein DotA/TraY
VAVGKGLIDSAVTSMGVASASAFAGGMLGALKVPSAAMADIASKLFLSITFIGISAGFVLYYVLPFLPFLYFYFAVASWIKAIYEAMVGVPLWALAHMRIDGDGLPGDAAQNGYFLILEIFIRPILTVVGLVAAIVIFATQVRILNLTWDLVVANASGFVDGTSIVGNVDPSGESFRRGIVDQFFFTIIYTVVCYMMATASFKLIDKIPDNILRWAGAGVSSYGDIDANQVESLNRYAVSGSMIFGDQGSSALAGTSAKAGQTLGKLIKDPPTQGTPSA